MTKVCVFEQFVLEETVHHVLVRGPERAPLLLLVQAGPGLPMIHEADALQAKLGLEERWRVVYWDQRGTGRSLDASREPLGHAALTRDLTALVAALCARFAVEQLDVVGFSLGGSLALLAAQSDPHIRRVVAVGPDIDLLESERFAWQFAREQALRRRHRRALRELVEIGPPPHESQQRFMTRVKWVTNFGGVAIGQSFLTLFGQMLFRLLRSPYYSIRQVVAALRGIQTTQSRALLGLRGFYLPSLLARVPVPVTIIQGRLDAAAPANLAVQFHDALDAPRGKRLVMLDDCAHSPHFEAPERFRALLVDALA